MDKRLVVRRICKSTVMIERTARHRPLWTAFVQLARASTPSRIDSLRAFLAADNSPTIAARGWPLRFDKRCPTLPRAEIPYGSTSTECSPLDDSLSCRFSMGPGSAKRRARLAPTLRHSGVRSDQIICRSNTFDRSTPAARNMDAKQSSGVVAERKGPSGPYVALPLRGRESRTDRRQTRRCPSSFTHSICWAKARYRSCNSSSSLWLRFRGASLMSTRSIRPPLNAKGGL